MKVTESDLRAYLAGDLEDAQSALIEAALARGDEDLEQRLRALDPLSAQLSGAFEGLPNGARLSNAAALVQGKSARMQGRAWGAIAAALVVGLGLGWGLTSQPQSSLDSDWRAQVAQYQALYVPQTVAQLDNPELQSQFENAEAALGRAFARTGLAQVGELTLVRVQVLGFKGAPLIQMAYRDTQGRPFALCLMQGEDGNGGAEKLAGLESYSWSDNGLRLILIGGESSGFVKDHAELASYFPFPKV